MPASEKTPSPSGSAGEPWRPVTVVLLAALLLACGPRKPPREPGEWTAPALLARADRAIEEGDGPRAEQYLVLAIERGAAVDVAVPRLLQVCIAADRYDTALAHAERYREHVRDRAGLDLLIASLHLALGDPERAHTVTDDLIALEPDPPALAYYLRATALLGLRRPREARADFARYLADEPAGRYRAEASRQLAGRRP